MPPCVRLLLATLALGIASSTAAAAAQECDADPAPADVERARALFLEASSDLEGLRWADAIPKFRRAYALSCAPSALYNLAMALRASGRHREARDAFARLLSAHPDASAETRASAATFRQEEAARVAALLLSGIDPDERPQMHLDGRDVSDDGTRPLRVEIDPGAHSLVAQIPEHRPFLWEGVLRDAETRTIELRFEPLPRGGGDDAILAVILSVAGAALIGAAIGVGVFLWDDAQVRPLSPDRLVVVSGR